MEKGITKNQILSELSRSPHGKLAEYVDMGQKALRQEPEFFAHLIAWDHKNGQVRDAKVALPVVSLSTPGFHPEFVDNSLAHLALLGPRELLKAFRFSLELRLPGRMRAMRRLVEDYLREREANWSKWERIAIQHKRTLKELYALAHVKPADRQNAVLFKGEHPAGSLFEVVAQLKDMAPAEAAGTIMEKKIPFLIAMGALGKKAQEPDLVMALISRMSPTELVTNTKLLERLGIKTNPVLRGAFEKALEKASKGKTNILKTTRAAEAMDDESLKEKLRGVQEKQIAALGGVEGNWLVLGDKSGSMKESIKVAVEVAGTLSKMVKGKVWLVFFNTSPQSIDVTGMSLDKIKVATRHITANGGTSIGCGLQRMLDSKEEIDGIAIVSDGEENTAPMFPQVYKKYAEWAGKEVPVYLYHCDGGSPSLPQTMAAAHIDLQVFELGGNVDYYSLPNMVNTMRTCRYSLVDEIMATKLLKLTDVLKHKAKMAAA
jgi:hypothetical protein